MTKVEVLDRVKSMVTESKETKGYETIVINVRGDIHGSRMIFNTKSFVGKWIIENYDTFSENFNKNTFSVALTKKGKILIGTVSEEEAISEEGDDCLMFHNFEVFDNFDEVSRKDRDIGYIPIPDSVISYIAEEFGINHVEELDI